MAYETEKWPYLEAKFHGGRRTVPVRLVVIHDMEFPEKVTAAEDIARYFHDMPDNREASCTIAVDSDSIVQCVPDSYIAYAAPGCNADGIQIELAGYGAQTPGQWRDFYSTALLAIGADATAQYCLKYDIPVRHLTDDELRAGAKGIVGHDQVSRVYKKSDHTDPGPSFPWPRFLAYVQASRDERAA